jgi:hypothetical protein
MKIEPKTKEELERNFVEAFERLVGANNAYDVGHLSEAPNIAKEVHSFIDKGKGRALLKHLGRQGISFVSSAQPMTPGNLAPEYRLIHATIGFDGMDYEPFLSKRRYDVLLAFEDWDSETVLAWVGKESIVRGELVEFIRHVEGGGHVAPRYERRWSGKLMGLMRGALHRRLHGVERRAVRRAGTPARAGLRDGQTDRLGNGRDPATRLPRPGRACRF